MKIVFFGTSKVGMPSLEALAKSHKILLVITKQDSPIYTAATALGLPISTPEKAKNNPELVSELKNLNADIFIVVSYGLILPEEIISIPQLQTINIHFSLLPKYRGASPIQYALLNGENKTGITIFILDKDMDTGPILTQSEVDILQTDTFTTLAERCSTISAELLLSTLNQYAGGEISPTEQDSNLATYTKIINREDGKIDWSQTAGQIYNQFRAYTPWPGIFTTWEGKTIKILDCVPTIESDGIVGTINSDGVVTCGDHTSLQIITLQIEGKKPTDTKSFLNGYKKIIGTGLG